MECISQLFSSCCPSAPAKPPQSAVDYPEEAPQKPKRDHHRHKREEGAMQALPRRLQSIAQPELDRRTGRYNSTSILYFYENQLRPENLGLSCTEVLKSDDNALEKMHTYIQWLFPTDEPSPHNPRAPVTDR